MTAQRAVVVGNLSWDRLVRVGELPKPNQDVFVESTSCVHGGAASNVAAVMGLAGIDVALFASVGLDKAGSDLIDELELYGVSTRLVQRVSARTSEFFVMMDEAGNRCFLLDPSQASFQLAWTDSLQSENIHALAFVGCPLTLAEEITYRLQPANRSLFMNLGFWIASGELANADLSFLENAAAVFLNQEEAAMLGTKQRSRSLDRVLRAGGQVITTNGTEPTVVRTLHKEFLFPVDEGKVENTLGCGDAFMGGYVSALLQGLSIRRAIQRAHRCARFVAGIPYERTKGMLVAE